MMFKLAECDLLDVSMPGQSTCLRRALALLLECLWRRIVEAKFLERSNLEILRRRYGHDMAVRQSQLMNDKHWGDAMAISHDLKESALHNGDVTVCTAICKKELGWKAKVLAILTQAHNEFGKIGSASET